MFCFGVLGLFASASANAEEQKNEMRAPAFPLVTIDPYTSAWSAADHLYDAPVTHWTGKEFPFIGMIKVDGEVYRFMGADKPICRPIVGTSEQEDWIGAFTTENPGSGWELPGFNDSSWSKGLAAFGTRESEDMAKTQWGTKEIWVRREFQINEDLDGKKIFLEYSHDDDAVIYINGTKVVETGNSYRKHVRKELSGEELRLLKKGENVIAAHCQNRIHGALLDFGIIEEIDSNPTKTAVQKSTDIQPMQTKYQFTCGKVDLDLVFTAPLFLDDLDLLSRPVNYISYEVRANDGQLHDVQIYLEAGPEWAIDRPDQTSVTETFIDGSNLVFLKSGSKEQQILAKRGDDVRIDWGYFYLATDRDRTQSAIGNLYTLREQFFAGTLKGDEKDGYDRMAFLRSLGRVDNAKGHFLIGYDDIYSIQYFKQNLRPYWNRDNNETILSQFQKAENDYDLLMKKVDEFNYNPELYTLSFETPPPPGVGIIVKAFTVGAFNEDLDIRELNILAEGMNVPYIEEAKNDENAMKYIVSGNSLRFFSQANHLNALNESVNNQKYHMVDSLISEYSYKGSEDEYKGLAGRGNG